MPALSTFDGTTDMKDIPLVDVIDVEPMQGHRLLLAFEDGTRGVFDMTPYLGLPAWSGLRDPTTFRAVRVDLGTVCWPGGIDMSPERLYAECLRVETPLAVA